MYIVLKSYWLLSSHVNVFTVLPSTTCRDCRHPVESLCNEISIAVITMLLPQDGVTEHVIDDVIVLFITPGYSVLNKYTTEAVTGLSSSLKVAINLSERRT